MPTQWSKACYSHAEKFGSARFTSDDGQHFGTLDFQDGSVAEFGRNGVFMEEVMQALIDRLEALNTPPFACRENSIAITKLQEALLWLEVRTKNRSSRGVLDTNTA